MKIKNIIRPETLEITIAIIAVVMLLTGVVIGTTLGAMPDVNVNAEAAPQAAPQETEAVVKADDNVIENPEEFFLTSAICGYDTPVSVFTNLLTGQTWAVVYLTDKEIGRYTLMDPNTGDVYRCYNIYEACAEIDEILNWNVEQGVVVIPQG